MENSMGLGVEKCDKLQAANFSLMKDNSSIQIKLIVNLLYNSIKLQKPITKDDITDTYVEWKFLNRTDVRIEKMIFNKELQKNEWRYVPVSKEEYRNNWRSQSASKQWFKSNLGAAIIKGKLLVIPIIEL